MGDGLFNKASTCVWVPPTWCAEVWALIWANIIACSWGGYAGVEVPLTALRSPTAWFARTTAAQASLDALKLALSPAPMLRPFNPRHASGVDKWPWRRS